MSNKKILALHFSLFCCKSIRKRKQGNKKEEGKVKGSQAIFYSMTVNKNIVHRSKVHSCTAVVWEKPCILKGGSSVLSILLSPLSVLWLFQGSVFAKWLMRVQYQ